MRGHRLGGFKFYRQYSVDRYILDFYCPAKKLAVEADGSQHADLNTEKYDQERTTYLNSLGITVLRFWNNEIQNQLNDVLETILQELTK